MIISRQCTHAISRSLAGTSRILLLVALAATCSAFASAQNLDQYGGRKDISCTNHAHGWSTEKIGNRWWVCTPQGHGMFLVVVENVNLTDAVSRRAVTMKYGGLDQWSETALQRMQAWGFNAIGPYAYRLVLPGHRSKAFPDGEHTVKLPYYSRVRPSYYSMRNPSITVYKPWGLKKLLDDPVKDVMGARSPFYSDYVPPGGVGDYGDDKMRQWLGEDLSNDRGWPAPGTPQDPYRMLVSMDDGDELWGLINGPEFTSIPPGHNSAQLAQMVISESPIQTANKALGFVYLDDVMYSKKMLHDYLFSKYKTIEMLNKAWRANYTTFDSSGVQVKNEAVATGDGATLAFRHTLAKLRPSRHSIQLFVNGRIVAGDTGTGAIYGHELTGSVNYDSGLLLLVFKPDAAPRTGDAVTVSYVQNGWGIGTGLMDEDMRPAHQVWLGNSWDEVSPMRRGSALKKPGAAVQADFDAYEKQAASWYFQMFAQAVHARFPGVLIAAGLSSWQVPAPAPVLQAAAKYVDVIDSPVILNSAKLNFMDKNFGKAMIGDLFLLANADSPFGGPAGTHPPTTYPTQAAKGQAYFNQVSALLNAQDSSGLNPFVGADLWSWMDDWSQKNNWGLVTHLDNAYDGHEDVKGAVKCSPPLQRFTCGGEPGNYGDYISKVKEANALWLDLPAQNPPEKER